MKNIVAVVGRPNVGKSTIFNKLAGERIAIVEDKPGVTRDRIYADVTWLDNEFTLVDTGGIEMDPETKLLEQMKMQAEIAIETADVIMFVVDSKTGLTDEDEKIANMLRRSGKEIILVVNKIDNMNARHLKVAEFYSLGLGEPNPISATQKLGLGDMLDNLISQFEIKGEINEDEDLIKVAVIGKPNAGKSSLINKIIGQERVIVSDIPGTTRDAVNTEVVVGENKFSFIDTAGIRKKGKVKPGVEKYSVIRSLNSVEKADVVLLVIDSEEGITKQDMKVSSIAHDKGKPVIILMNKWDLIDKDRNNIQAIKNDIDFKFRYMKYAKKLFISALTGKRVHKIYDMIKASYESSKKRVSTGLLNEVLYEALAINEPPMKKGRRLKVYYATQVSIKPPTFVIFVNDSKLSHFSYERYLNNKFREAFGFDGTPIRIIFRSKKNKDYIKR